MQTHLHLCPGWVQILESINLKRRWSWRIDSRKHKSETQRSETHKSESINLKRRIGRRNTVTVTSSLLPLETIIMALDRRKKNNPDFCLHYSSFLHGLCRYSLYQRSPRWRPLLVHLHSRPFYCRPNEIKTTIIGKARTKATVDLSVDERILRTKIVTVRGVWGTTGSCTVTRGDRASNVRRSFTVDIKDGWWDSFKLRSRQPTVKKTITRDWAKYRR